MNRRTRRLLRGQRPHVGLVYGLSLLIGVPMGVLLPGWLEGWW